MRHRTLRSFSRLGCTGWLVATLAQAQVAHPPQPLPLPGRLGVLKPVQVNDLEATSPGLGQSVRLEGRGLTATLFVYNLGLSRIPENPNSSLFKAHFQDCLREVEHAAPRPLYQEVRRISQDDTLLLPADSLHPDGIRARIALFRLRMGGRLYHSWLVLAAQNNHFIKLRYSYPVWQRQRLLPVERDLLNGLGAYIRDLPPLE